MDRDTLKRHLTKVEEQVAIVAQNVARQRELVAELERDGYDATQAKKMLEQFLEQQALHIADRDRLIKGCANYRRPFSRRIPLVRIFAASAGHNQNRCAGCRSGFRQAEARRQFKAAVGVGGFGGK